MDIQWTASEMTLNEYGKAFVDKYKGKLANKGWTQGELYKTASFNIDMGDTSWIVNINLEEYWKFVEEGRSAGRMPPITSIESWISARQILPRPMSLKSGRTVTPTIHQLAYLIARKIGRTGLPGHHLFKETQEELRKQLITDLQVSITTDIVTYMLSK